jgi:parallel beta-helix repeat protein
MFKKGFSVVIMELLFVNMIMLVFNVRPTMADTQTVYINADGSIIPVGAPIMTFDNITYTFTDNIQYPTYQGIVVQRSNIVINGNGYTVEGNQSVLTYGLYLASISNVTIKNINVKNSAGGIGLGYSSSNTISGNNVTGNLYEGIGLGYSSSNTISGNNIVNDGYGIGLGHSSNNSISGNNIANNWEGIYLYSAYNNSIIGNNLTSNTGYGIIIYPSSSNSISGNMFTDCGLYVWDSYQNSVEANTVDGRPLVYLEDVTNYSVSDAGQVVLVRCDGIRVENTSLSKANVDIELWETNNSDISQNKIMENGDGIWLLYSSNNSIRGNNMVGKDIAYDGYGIRLYPSSNYNSIIGNNIKANSEGIVLEYSSNNSIIRNNITNNSDGIFLGRSSNYNSIIGNNLTANNFRGISLYSSSNNSIIGNNIKANDYYGIEIDNCSSNKIYHNNFINNTSQVWIYHSISPNIWDDGYPSGGNHWNDYNGKDLYSGPYQNVTGSDGIGDTPYVVYVSGSPYGINTDNYPLMGPYLCFDGISTVSNSTISNFQIKEAAISFNVTGPPDSKGFCTLMIPHSTLLPSYIVMVDNHLIPYTYVFENDTLSIIYFTYEHSMHEVTITGYSSGVSEGLGIPHEN